jgi:type IV pilus assembly protein PilB
VEADYDDQVLEMAKLPSGWMDQVTLYRGEGCDKCNETGYKGRQGLYEVMAMNAKIRKLIMQEVSTDELQTEAIADGMLTLRMDGLRKLEKGITTLEEVMKETAAGS